ncbi:MAG TPA: alcohol dehydrogenase catalytic domain-containing protein [Gaiellaceae bacterium]
MRAVVLDRDRQPRLDDVAEPGGEGELVRVHACGLCGSDVEKIGRAAPGTVLGHEVVAARDRGERVVLIHHLPCGACARCRAGHESTCERFSEATIRPGGFAERARSDAFVPLPDSIGNAVGTYAEPLACVLRGAERVPSGRVLVVGGGFIGQLFAAVLRHRGDDVFVHDRIPERATGLPDAPVEAAVLCARGGAATALAALAPAGVVLVFADAGWLDLDPVYRSELTVIGSRSATPRHVREAIDLLPVLDLPEPVTLPLEEFPVGLDLYRRNEAVKVVFTP